MNGHTYRYLLEIKLGRSMIHWCLYYFFLKSPWKQILFEKYVFFFEQHILVLCQKDPWLLQVLQFTIDWTTYVCQTIDQTHHCIDSKFNKRVFFDLLNQCCKKIKKKYIFHTSYQSASSYTVQVTTGLMLPVFLISGIEIHTIFSS